MRRGGTLGLAWIGAVLLCAPVQADDEEIEIRWSLTPFMQYTWIDEDEDDDDVTGFFDQYEFTPNKSTSFPFEIGLRDASLDLLGAGETPLLQFRLESPTSNLGVSGNQIDDPFFNQRALLLGRYGGFALDMRYQRIRTQALRAFPNTPFPPGLTFDDRSAPDDRFERDRTGFDGELRMRPNEALSAGGWIGESAGLELALRGGYEVRDGQRQPRFIVEPANAWAGLAQDREQNVADIGGGLLLAPAGLFTVTLDFDHERFREDASTILQDDLGGGIPPGNETIAFIPDTDRYTGTALARGAIGERVVLEGGFQFSQLEQVDGYTPTQRAAGLRDNEVQYYSANLTADVAILEQLAANAYFKFDQRDNDIERDTLLFNDANGTQVDAFMNRWTRILAGIEAEYRINAANRLALGGRFESVDRDLDFALPPSARILEENALVDDDTESYTIYGRARLRAARRINVSGEVGYRDSPDTGYVTDLDDYVYGKMRASYTLPLERAVVLSFFARGGSGDNRDLTMVSGVGDPPGGSRVRRRFERYDWLWGLTANASPWDRIGVFGSIFMSRDSQDYHLTGSSRQRYLQPLLPVDFLDRGSPGYENDQLSIVLGAHLELGDRSDAALSYAFTRAETNYDAGSSPQLGLVSQNREIDSDTHSVDLEVGHWLRDGLRVMAGYRLQYHHDDEDLHLSQNSAVLPFDLDDTRHRVMLGVTLNSELLEP
jgi:hypothetical protein